MILLLLCIVYCCTTVICVMHYELLIFIYGKFSVFGVWGWFIYILHVQHSFLSVAPLFFSSLFFVCYVMGASSSPAFLPCAPQQTNNKKEWEYESDWESESEISVLTFIDLFIPGDHLNYLFWTTIKDSGQPNKQHHKHSVLHTTNIKYFILCIWTQQRNSKLHHV